jgi:hypothetical protein
LLPHTAMADTPNDGDHYYYKHSGRRGLPHLVAHRLRHLRCAR